MDQGLIEVEDQCFSSDISFPLWANQPLLVIIFWLSHLLLLLLLRDHLWRVCSLRDLCDQRRKSITLLSLRLRLSAIRSSLRSASSLRLIGAAPLLLLLLLLLHLLHLLHLLLLLLLQICILLLLSHGDLLLQHLLLQEFLVQGLLLPLLLNLLFKLLILVSVPDL